MQRTFFGASAFSAMIFVISPAVSLAGEKQGQHQPSPRYQPAPMPVAAGVPAAVRPVAVQPVSAPTPVIQAVPVYLPLSYGSTVVQNVTVVQRAAPEQRPVQPLSFHIANPNSVAAKLPSGRVVVAPAPGSYVPSPDELAYQHALRRPYAPPTIQVIGDTPSQHMGRPVKLTYGAPLPQAHEVGPRVVWLDRKGGQSHHAPEPEHHNSYVRYMK